MESVGQKLREVRLRRGLTLEQISAATRIPYNILRAIEADHVSKVRGAFFYKSFVRQYATQIDLSCESLEDSIRVAAGIFPEPYPSKSASQDVTWTPKVAALPSVGRKGHRLLYSFASLVIMVAACSTVSTYWESSKSIRSAAFKHSVEAQGGQTMASLGSSQNRIAAPAASSTETIAQPLAPRQASPKEDYLIQVSAIERTWLSIVTDGKQMFRGILKPAETKILEGREMARIRTGNAGGVTIVFNGRELGTIGPRGHVRTVVFTKDSYEVVAPAPRLSFVLFSQSGE